MSAGLEIIENSARVLARSLDDLARGGTDEAMAAVRTRMSTAFREIAESGALLDDAVADTARLFGQTPEEFLQGRILERAVDLGVENPEVIYRAANVNGVMRESFEAVEAAATRGVDEVVEEVASPAANAADDTVEVLDDTTTAPPRGAPETPPGGTGAGAEGASKTWFEATKDTASSLLSFAGRNLKWPAMAVGGWAAVSGTYNYFTQDGPEETRETFVESVVEQVPLVGSFLLRTQQNLDTALEVSRQNYDLEQQNRELVGRLTGQDFSWLPQNEASPEGFSSLDYLQKYAESMSAVAGEGNSLNPGSFVASLTSDYDNVDWSEQDIQTITTAFASAINEAFPENNAVIEENRIPEVRARFIETLEAGLDGLSDFEKAVTVDIFAAGGVEGLDRAEGHINRGNLFDQALDM